MATRSELDIDDDFSDIYKAYTGPLGTNTSNNNNSTQEKATTNNNKRHNSGSDDEEEIRDPNAVPTDFTSREAKVWEAKTKATERNWKKRKEEEMICKICGESGHFTQGCPSTLGSNRKSQDFFERVPARDKHVRALFTEKVTQKIEKDIGCKFKMDEKFIIISGKDRLILAKGVEAVRKVIEEGGDQPRASSSSSQVTRSRSPERRSPVGQRHSRPNSQRSSSGPHRTAQPPVQTQQRFHRHEIPAKLSRDSSQAYGNDGRSSRSKSPVCVPYVSSSYSTYDGRTVGTYKADGWDSERRKPDSQSGGQFDLPVVPKSLEDLEMEFKREAIELERIRDKEEDEENRKHREALREMRENHTKKLGMLRGIHSKQWDEFLQLDTQRLQRQQIQARQQMSSSGYGNFKQQSFSNYDGSLGNPRYAGPNMVMESINNHNRYPNPIDQSYPSRPHHENNFGGDFQRQRCDDYGKPYNQY